MRDKYKINSLLVRSRDLISAVEFIPYPPRKRLVPSSCIISAEYISDQE